MNRRRFQFHLQGQHDQQSHAGGSSTMEVQGVDVAVGDVIVIKDPLRRVVGAGYRPSWRGKVLSKTPQGTNRIRFETDAGDHIVGKFDRVVVESTPEMSTRAQFRFDPSQPRDESGRWTSTGGSSGSGGATVGSEGDSAAPIRSLGESVPIPTRAELEAAFDPIPETPETESTFLDHMDENGNLSPERQAVHDQLINDKLTDADGNPLPSQENPKALMLGGGAAAGKSSTIEAGFVQTPDDAVTVNPDEFKIELPEAKGPSSDGKQGNGLADRVGDAWASMTHEESSHLGKRLQRGAMDRRNNIVIDKTSSDPAKAVREVQRLQAEGYDVDVAYVTTDIDTAVSNALGRQARIGRAVPETVLRAGHTGANEAFLAVATQTTARSQLLTTRPPAPDGTKFPPVLTAESTGDGRIRVVNQDAWGQYLQRVPNIPPDLDLIDEQLAAALVASSGTLTPVVGMDRMKALYGAALKGSKPDGLTDDEATVYDQLVNEIAELREAGIAPDFPIDDIFAEEEAAPTRSFRVQTPS